MTTTNEMLRSLFKNLATRLEERLAHRSGDDTKDSADRKEDGFPHVNDGQLVADLGDPSPIVLFVSRTRQACHSLLGAKGQNPGDSSPPAVDSQAPTTARATELP